MLSPSRSFSRVTKAQREVEGRERRTAHSPVIPSRSHGAGCQLALEPLASLVDGTGADQVFRLG